MNLLKLLKIKFTYYYNFFIDSLIDLKIYKNNKLFLYRIYECILILYYCIIEDIYYIKLDLISLKNRYKKMSIFKHILFIFFLIMGFVPVIVVFVIFFFLLKYIIKYIFIIIDILVFDDNVNNKKYIFLRDNLNSIFILIPRWLKKIYIFLFKSHWFKYFYNKIKNYLIIKIFKLLKKWVKKFDIFVLIYIPNKYKLLCIHIREWWPIIVIYLIKIKKNIIYFFWFIVKLIVYFYRVIRYIIRRIIWSYKCFEWKIKKKYWKIRIKIKRIKWFIEDKFNKFYYPKYYKIRHFYFYMRLYFKFLKELDLVWNTIYIYFDTLFCVWICRLKAIYPISWYYIYYYILLYLVRIKVEYSIWKINLYGYLKQDWIRGRRVVLVDFRKKIAYRAYRPGYWAERSGYGIFPRYIYYYIKSKINNIKLFFKIIKKYLKIKRIIKFIFRYIKTFIIKIFVSLFYQRIFDFLLDSVPQRFERTFRFWYNFLINKTIAPFFKRGWYYPKHKRPTYKRAYKKAMRGLDSTYVYWKAHSYIFPRKAIMNEYKEVRFLDEIDEEFEKAEMDKILKYWNIRVIEYKKVKKLDDKFEADPFYNLLEYVEELKIYYKVIHENKYYGIGHPWNTVE